MLPTETINEDFAVWLSVYLHESGIPLHEKQNFSRKSKECIIFIVLCESNGTDFKQG
jgi:hypothetical protein